MEPVDVLPVEERTDQRVSLSDFEPATVTVVLENDLDPPAQFGRAIDQRTDRHREHRDEVERDIASIGQDDPSREGRMIVGVRVDREIPGDDEGAPTEKASPLESSRSRR